MNYLTALFWGSTGVIFFIVSFFWNDFRMAVFSFSSFFIFTILANAMPDITRTYIMPASAPVYGYAYTEHYTEIASANMCYAFAIFSLLLCIAQIFSMWQIRKAMKTNVKRKG